MRSDKMAMATTAGRYLALVLHGVGHLKLEDHLVSPPGYGEVQLSMHTVGICGSDIHFWKEGRIGNLVITPPMVLGHEASGVVCAVGEGVTNLMVGDRVAVEPGVPCRVCALCKTGRYNLCADAKFCGSPPIYGTLCQRHNHAADFCYKLPEHISLEEGALLEPLSVAVHACRRGGVTVGNSVVICGAGPIGLVTLLTARACGATKIAITDLDEGRLKKAKELGADYTVKVESKESMEVAKKVIECFGRADQTIECTGVQSSIHTGIYVTKSGGVFVLVGSSSETHFEMPMFEARRREIDIRGVFRYSNCYQTALYLLASGAVDVKPLITHHFKLKDSQQAFETSSRGAGGAIKVLIHCNE